MKKRQPSWCEEDVLVFAYAFRELSEGKCEKWQEIHL